MSLFFTNNTKNLRHVYKKAGEGDASEASYPVQPRQRMKFKMMKKAPTLAFMSRNHKLKIQKRGWRMRYIIEPAPK